MDQQTRGGPVPGAAFRPTEQASTTDVAREQAGSVAGSAADAGRHVAGTAADQADQVVQETRRQASDLLQQARQEATEQARKSRGQAVSGLRSLAAELHQMARNNDEQGPASDLAEQAAGRVDDAAGWLERHEPGEVLDSVRRLARRRPGAFLAGAALAGVLAGRLTRGTVDAHRDTDDDTGSALRQEPGVGAAQQGYGAPSGFPPPSYGPPGGAPVPPPPPYYGPPGGTVAPPQPPPGRQAPPFPPGPPTTVPPTHLPPQGPPRGGPSVIQTPPRPADQGVTPPPPRRLDERTGETFVDDLDRSGYSDPGGPR